LKRIFAALFFLFAAAPSYAASVLTAEERDERRLQFNEYAQNRLQALEAGDEAAGGRPWALDLTGAYGYDSNAVIDTPRTGDRFVEGDAAFRWAGEGPVSWDAAVNTITYEDESESDYWDASVAPTVEFELGPSFGLRETWTLSYVHYPQDEDLRYWKNALLTELQHKPWERVAHGPYHEVEFRSFTDRDALTAGNQPGPDLRHDVRHEAGWSASWEPWSGTAFGARAAYQNNRSNDVFNDFNDYHGGTFSGYAYRNLAPRVSIVGLAGYDLKKYESRTFLPPLPRFNPKPERDNFWYAGASLYFSVNESVALGLHYLRSENTSNDVQQKYGGNQISFSLGWSV